MRPSSAVSVSRPSHAGAAQELFEVRGRRLRLGHDDVLAFALAVLVAEDVREDAEQPRLAVGARLEGVEEAVGAQQRLLNQVLGVLLVAGHPQRRGVERARCGSASRSKSALMGRRFIGLSGPCQKPGYPVSYSTVS